MSSLRHGAGGDASWHRSGRDDVLRRGDRSSAVVEIRSALAALGLVDNPDENLTTGRHVAADGFVGEATYRALKEASYRLGARTLVHQFGAPMYGDDVATLQSKLQELGFY